VRAIDNEDGLATRRAPIDARLVVRKRIESARIDRILDVLRLALGVVAPVRDQLRRRGGLRGGEHGERAD
jgi:hypothetical protein